MGAGMSGASMAGAVAAGDLARAAPARRRTRHRTRMDITIGGRVERHARLLASLWLRRPSDYPGASYITSATRRATPSRSRYAPADSSPVLKQALTREGQ